MPINVPPVVRFALYVATVLGTPIVEYLRARGVIGGLEVALWDSETAAVAAMAAFNVARDSLPLPAQLLEVSAPAGRPLPGTIPNLGSDPVAAAPAPAADAPADPVAPATPAAPSA